MNHSERGRLAGLASAARRDARERAEGWRRLLAFDPRLATTEVERWIDAWRLRRAGREADGMA